MSRLGTFNELEILRLSAKGAQLRLDDGRELLLPAAEVPPEAAIGASLKVFLYLDGNDRPAATTRTPAACVREVAWLKINDVTDAGAFLDWGLPKDLLLPWNEVKREQKRLVVAGRKLLVCVFQAEDGRIAASARLDEFLVDETEDFKEGEQVSVIVAEPTDLGVRVVVNHRVWGMVHNNEIFGTLHRGMKLDGFVKALRPDHKLNISLSAPGYQKIDAVAQRVLGTLARRGGFMAVTDRTPAEEIHSLFGISKKVFKQTLGALYRNRNITLEETGIRLLKGPTDR